MNARTSRPAGPQYGTAPPTDPPFDDDATGTASPAIHHTGGPAAPRLPHERSAAPSAGESDQVPTRARPTTAHRHPPDSGRPALADPRRWCARISQAIAEILYGWRQVHQLARWTSEDVYRQLCRRAAGQRGTAPPAAPPTVRTMRLCRINSRVVEAGVVLQTGTLVQALALRFEAVDGRWLCTACEML